MGYIPGLDGIRAIAVLAVLLYHSGVAAVPGGFLGVDVFFVLSGFLISTLLLQEIERTSAVSFGQFYLRRARRLLPALLATLAVASLAYVTNWWYVVQDLSYFEVMGRPPMLQHLWSLAVEEQFYLLWPLCLVLLYRWRGRPGVGRVAFTVALVSTLLMALGSFIWNLPAAGDASPSGTQPTAFSCVAPHSWNGVLARASSSWVRSACQPGAMRYTMRFLNTWVIPDLIAVNA